MRRAKTPSFNQIHPDLAITLCRILIFMENGGMGGEMFRGKGVLKLSRYKKGESKFSEIRGAIFLLCL